MDARKIKKTTCKKNHKTSLANLIIFLMFVGYLAIVTNKASATTEITQFGITWKFDRDYTVGQFANGDYWVVGPVNIIEINPPSQDVSGRTMNGSMVNPSPTNGNQGYDNGMAYVTYDSSLNKAFNVSSGSPLVLPSGSSLVSTISLPTTGVRPQLKGASILTVLSSAPADGSFRPPYSGTDKTIKFNKTDLDYLHLKNLAAVTGTRALATVERWFERPWIDHKIDWTARYQHPADNMPDYGQSMSMQIGDAVLMLNLDFTDAQKEKLLISLVQVGIDFYGIAQAGGYWPANGGHSLGRLLPIQLAGLVLGDADMLAVAEFTNPNVPESAYHSPQLPKVIFSELQSTFYVDALSVSITQSNTPIPWDPDYDNLPTYPPLPYRTEDIGLPEFGIRHLARPQMDNFNFNTLSTYRSINGAALTSHALAALILGIKADWKHDAFFDYHDRWFTLTDGYQAAQNVGTFCHNMWDRYRANYGNIWTSAPTDLSFAPIGNKEVNEGSTLTFTVDVNDPNMEPFIKEHYLPSEPNFINNTFSWTSDYNDAGIYEVTFVAQNDPVDQNDLIEDIETITITVKNVNRSPPVLAAIGNQSVNENSILNFSVSATDLDGDSITYSAENLPTGATFAGQTFNWTPNYNQAGTYQITIIATDGQAQDSQTVNLTVNDIITNIYESEDAVLSGSVVSSVFPGYAGTGFADYVNPSNDYVEWTVNVNTSGQYELQFRYALASGDRPLQIKVNGQVVVSSLSFPATGSWTSWATVSTTVTLNNGQNTIRATAIGSSGGNVDNLKIIASAADTTPPSPTTLTWAVPPAAAGQTSISMTATTAVDTASSPVSYYFECTTNSSKSSGWQSSPAYTATDLTAGTAYTFRCKARDNAATPNETGWSATASATTVSAADTTPPSPTTLTWAVPPAAAGQTSISMTATTAVDTASSPVSYYFECTTNSSKSSGWQSSPAYTATDLTAGTAYTFRCKARDNAATPNETGWSATASATTVSAADTTPPSPTTLTWAVPPAAAGQTSISMTATIAVDTASSPVWYYFECTTNSSKSSKWQISPAYTATDLTAGTVYTFRCKACDNAAIGNETGWSATASATIASAADTTPPSPTTLTWAVPPAAAGQTSISMTATTAVDTASSPVWYYFECITNSSKSSKWQISPVYTATGLTAGTVYTFMCKACDNAAIGNETGWSATASATIASAADTTPPSPTTLTWAVPPAAAGQTSISMTATTAVDTASSPVSYYFECTTNSSKSSGWQSSPAYTATGLTAGTAYTFRCKARDNAATPNETGWSATASATIASAADTTPPSPTTLTWAVPPAAAGQTSISMTATTAVDTASSPVWYYFECITNSSKSSKWQISPVYTATGLTAGTVYTFMCKACDNAAIGNETGWSATASATIASAADTTPPSPTTLTWAVPPAAAGQTSISMTATTAVDATSSPVSYYFECTTNSSKSSGWQSSPAYTATGLTAGTAYTFRCKARDNAATPNETGWSSSLSATTQSAVQTQTTYEAESAVLSGSVVNSVIAGYTGTGFADYVNPSNDYVEWTVNVNTSGQYELQFRYALASGDRPLQIKVNGQVVVSSLSFPATGSWTSWATVSTTVTLNNGQNTIRATAIGSSGGNVDNLKVISQ